MTTAPNGIVALTVLGLVAAIGWFDYATGWELDASALFALPLVLIVLRTDRRAGFALAVLCTAVWWLARIGGHPYQTGWGFALALVVRLFLFSVVVVAAAAAKAQWELGKARIAMLERTQYLEGEILEASEREQQRFGRDLHDGLCQTLAGIAALSATQARRLAAHGDADACAAATAITRMLNEAIGEARDLARGLGPTGLQETDLPGALEDLALNVQRRFSVACALECDGRLPALGEDVEAHLFRISQEAMNNAVTHGRADQLAIRLECDGGRGRLEVRDNGVGIPDEARQGDGIGLRTMAYRARLIGGSLAVDRRASGGTAVACTFPLPATAITGARPNHARTDS